MRPLMTALAIAAATAGCQSGTPSNVPAGESAAPAPATTGAVIHARALVREKIFVPPDSTLHVQLLDNLLADTPKAVLAEHSGPAGNGPVYTIALPYDPAKLREGGLYGLHVSLRMPDGSLAFVTDTRVPVVPGDAAPVEFVLKHVPAQ